MRIRILVILSTAAALCLFLAVLRERTVAMGWDTFQSPLSMFPRMLARSFYDFVLVLIITLFFLAVLYIVRNRPKLQNIISGGYAVVALLLLLSAMVNIPSTVRLSVAVLRGFSADAPVA